MIDITLDTMRVGHMLSFAIGIGTAAFLTVSVFRRFRNGIDIEGLRLLLNGHDLVRYALIGLWATGAGLLFFRLVILCEMPNAKLIAKFLIVSALTLNMRVIGQYLIPELFVWEGSRLAEIPAQIRMELGALAGFSAGLWCAALVLGGFHRMKMMNAWELAGVLLPLILAAVITGTLAGWLAGRVGGGWPRNRMRGRADMVPGE